MHKLRRQVRFSINPFLAELGDGFNSFAGEPVGEGLAIFLDLSVELMGDIDTGTGFVVNVVEIDKKVRKYAVPIFADRIKKKYEAAEHIGILEIVEILKLTWAELADKFGKVQLNELALKLNPFRKIAINSEGCEMIYFSEKFEFAAMHKLWNDKFSAEKNFEVFGKCANPSGHGHNYTVEVTLKKTVLKKDFCIGEFEKIVNDKLVKIVDHKNLNVDVEEFKEVIPSVENIAAFAWNKLVGRFGESILHCVVIWETDRTCCSYYG